MSVILGFVHCVTHAILSHVFSYPKCLLLLKVLGCFFGESNAFYLNLFLRCYALKPSPECSSFLLCVTLLSSALCFLQMCDGAGLCALFC